MDLSMPSLLPVTKILLTLLALTAAIFDLRYRRIPNWLVASGAMVALALNTFLFELDGLRASLLGLGLAALLYIPLFALRAMGAGDVKLMGTIGLLVGPGPWLVIFLCSGIAGGILAIILILSKRRLLTTFQNVAFIMTELSQFRAPYLHREELDVAHPKAVSLPHAVSIAAGSLAYLAILTIRGS